MKPFAASPSSSGLKNALRFGSGLTSPKHTTYLEQLKAAPQPPRPDGIPFPGLYDFFMNPMTPLLFGIIYFIVAKTLSYKQDGKNRIRGKFWDALVIAHNIALAAYSGWTFMSVAPIMFGAFFRALRDNGIKGLAHVFCDSDLSLWTSTQFPRICYIFYLSKYYEIVDTAIILAKGKKVKMLQSYHHAGAVWTMYSGYRMASPPIWIFNVFNSFIHTVMYCYYTSSALKLPFPRFLKKSLTSMQITQFIVGGSLAASYLFIRLPSFGNVKPSLATTPAYGQLTAGSLQRAGEVCLREAGPRAAVVLNLAYLAPLTWLFYAFFVESYRSKGNLSATARKAVKSAKITSKED